MRGRPRHDYATPDISPTEIDSVEARSIPGPCASRTCGPQGSLSGTVSGSLCRPVETELIIEIGWCRLTQPVPTHL
jgi:hypothetical protein